MIIEKADKRHLAGVLRIEKEAFTAPWSENSFLDELMAEESHFTVGTENGEVCAFLIMRIFGNEAEIFNIAVSEKWQRKKMALKLLSESIDYARENGVKKIFLEVRKSNMPARSLYEKLGFAGYFERKNYYDSPREDAVLMMWEQGDTDVNSVN